MLNFLAISNPTNRRTIHLNRRSSTVCSAVKCSNYLSTFQSTKKRQKAELATLNKLKCWVNIAEANEWNNAQAKFPLCSIEFEQTKTNHEKCFLTPSILLPNVFPKIESRSPKIGRHNQKSKHDSYFWRSRLRKKLLTRQSTLFLFTSSRKSDELRQKILICVIKYSYSGQRQFAD